MNEAKFLGRLRLGATCLALSMCALPLQAWSQTVLSYSPWNPRGYVVNDAIYPWMDKVKEVTDGRVSIEVRAAAVGAPREQADVVRDGLADISLVVPGYTPGRYPLLEIAELPLISDDAARFAPAIARIYDKYLAALKPFDGAIVLSAFNVAPAQLATGDPVRSVDDLSGLKLYISNRPTSTAMAELGVSPVSASVAETFSMASTGVIDGAVFPFEPTLTFGLEPYLTNFTIVPGGLGQAGMFLVVNEARWEAISEEDRAAIMAISGETLAGQIGQAVGAGETEARTKLQADGATFTEMAPDLYAALKAKVDPIYDAWAKKAESKGLDNAPEVLAELRSIAADPTTKAELGN